MFQNRNVFISFRRIRYREASFVYRDLMFSGVVPWLSDHCISAAEALTFLENPDKLEPVLTNAIDQADAAIVVVDQGYFDSRWTCLEYERLLSSNAPCVISLIDGASVPARFSPHNSDSVMVREGISSAVQALCEMYSMPLVPYVGKCLSDSRQFSLSGYDFRHPHWFSLDSDNGRWLTPQGDEMWIRVTDIAGKYPSSILERLSDGSHGDMTQIHDFFESELWRQVKRICGISAYGLRTVGYHKFPIDGLGSTGLGLSLQLTDCSGFCRYAKVLDASRLTEIEVIYFVKGSLQRFHTMIPDMDDVIVSLHRADETVGVSRADWYLPSKADSTASDFIWARCSRCQNQCTPRDAMATACPMCAWDVVECCSVNCAERKRMRASDLIAEVVRERKRLGMPGAGVRMADEPSLLCESCLSSMYIPGQLITELDSRSGQAMPDVYSSRVSLYIGWLALCAYGITFNTGPIYQWLLGFVALFMTFEPFEKGAATDPLSPLQRYIHILNFVPFGLSLVWIWAKSAAASLHPLPGAFDDLRSQATLAIVGSLVTLSLSLRALGVRARHREAHLIHAALYAAPYSLLLVWRYPIVSKAGLPGFAPVALFLSIMSAVVPALLLDHSSVSGVFRPGDLWDNPNSREGRVP
jgi:hypothetical protein